MEKRCEEGSADSGVQVQLEEDADGSEKQR